MGLGRNFESQVTSLSSCLVRAASSIIEITHETRGFLRLTSGARRESLEQRNAAQHRLFKQLTKFK